MNVRLASVVCLLQDAGRVIVRTRTGLLSARILTFLRILHIRHLTHERTPTTLRSQTCSSTSTFRFLLLLIVWHTPIIQLCIGFLKLTDILLEHLLYFHLVLLIDSLEISNTISAAPERIALYSALRVICMLLCRHIFLVC